MWYAGIDLHRETAVVALVDESGERAAARTFQCSRPERIVEYFLEHRPFRAVIEASCFYRWLYDLLRPHGEVVLAHPLRLRAIWSGRAKTDKLDARVLADLLRAELIPESYVPPERYQALRDLTRARARLVRGRTKAQNGLHFLLGRYNLRAPYRMPFGARGLKWLESLELPPASALVRDELVERVRYFDRRVRKLDEELARVAGEFPETEALTPLHGVGLYSALLVVAEIGEPGRFRSARQVAAYAGLTPRVKQSGAALKRGRISKEGSAWLRWILVQAAIKVVRRDGALKCFYERIRRRAGAKRARVAVARKLAEISWKRLVRWHAA